MHFSSPSVLLILISAFAHSSRLVVHGRQSPDQTVVALPPPSLLDGGGDAPPAFAALLDALARMQDHYFEVWEGTWPGAIDWTAAVMGTQVSATLSAISDFEADRDCGRRGERSRGRRENLINRYFTQITSFYFGENAFSVRTQAFDDMLWVVLGWLESIKFIGLHSHAKCEAADDASGFHGHPHAGAWYGRQFIPQFAHRARLFYDLASAGWDPSLCGGGMIWSPYLAPYKNAITNQLFIAASVGMYFDFPGDDNSSPFVNAQSTEHAHAMPPAKAHDPKYLDAAIEGYTWLKASNMTNEQGLYVDGFHIQGWRGGNNGSQGSGNCDVRDEMVYTYNQGVLLSGLRGLWRATGSASYLEDGHDLIRNVITATGWHRRHTPERWEWAGIGRNGVLEEACDSSGSCTQNSHTFKGIFFHHLNVFCTPLPRRRFDRHGTTVVVDDDAARLHQNRCDDYGAWITHNARAAYVTRDSDGNFGTWWGIPFQQPIQPDTGDCTRPGEGTDYRNDGVPKNDIWRLPGDVALDDGGDDGREAGVDVCELGEDRPSDPNDRGRGRTVETQSGGVAVLRALWQAVDGRRLWDQDGRGG